MRHDLKYRRVLRTKEQYITRYTTFGVLCFTAYVSKLVWDLRHSKSEVNSLTFKINKLKDSDIEDDASNAIINFQQELTRSGILQYLIDDCGFL